MTILLFLACTVEDHRVSLMKSWGEQIFIPSYKNFADQTQDLYEAAIPFCSNPSQSSLTDLQQRWWNAREPWKKMELLAFGPYKNLPDRLGVQIDFWPLRTSTVDDILLGEQPLTPEAIEALGASSKGLPVVEYLLYSVLPNDIESSRGCAYLLGTTFDLSQRARDMHHAWAPEGGNYLGQMVEPHIHLGEYESIEESLAEIVNRLGHTVENIRADKLLKGLGNNIGVVQESFVESRFSHRSLQDIRNNLEGIHEVYFGDPTGKGIDDYLKTRGYNIDEDFLSHYQKCIDAIDALENNGTLIENMHTNAEGVLELSQLLSELQNLIQGDILGAMSLWLTFNDADGD